MTASNGVKHTPTAAALKAEWERDKAQAVRDYEEENRAREVNISRLGVLSLAKERTESKTTTLPRSVKKKASTQTRSAAISASDITRRKHPSTRAAWHKSSPFIARRVTRAALPNLRSQLYR